MGYNQITEHRDALLCQTSVAWRLEMGGLGEVEKKRRKRRWFMDVEEEVEERKNSQVEVNGYGDD